MKGVLHLEEQIKSFAEEHPEWDYDPKHCKDEYGECGFTIFHDDGRVEVIDCDGDCGNNVLRNEEG